MDRITDAIVSRVESCWVNHGYLVGLGTAALATVPVSLYLYKRYMCSRMKQKMVARARRSQLGIEQQKRELEKRSTSIDMNLVKMSFQELQEALQSGKVKASSVLQAYQFIALTVNEDINAITDVITDATASAKDLDRLEPTKRGPLHGIPISVKESCGIKGLDCTAGFGELIDVPMSKDGVLVQVLKAKGAIPFVRTNLPQGMRSFACCNPIYGRTHNPHDLTRGPGGSSGGEGAIIGAQGSILGVGSDIAGSVRIPANFSGICTLKPTSGRLSLNGNFSNGTLGAQNIVPPTDGPMGRDVVSLVSFMDAVLCQELFQLDPTVPPVTFNKEVYNSHKPLKIGYYLYDGCTRCIPAVERAVLLAKSTLEKLGHTLVEIKPYKAMYAFENLLLPGLLGDDGDGYMNLIKYDNTEQCMVDFVGFQRKPYIERWLRAKLKELFTNDSIDVAIMKREPLRTITDWFRKTNEAKAFRKAFTENWLSQGLDAVICPCMPCVATTSGIDEQSLGAVTYTSFYNVVNYPAGSLPVTKVTEIDVAKTRDPNFYNAQTVMEKTIQADTEGAVGLPVGIQVVGLPFTEELVLRVMTELETGLAAQ